jgi:hypothetical protein
MVGASIGTTTDNRNLTVFKPTMANFNTPFHGMLKDTLTMVPTNGRIEILIVGGDFHSFRIMVNVFYWNHCQTMGTSPFSNQPWRI